MSLSDPIADILTRIRNAKNAKHKYVDVSSSKAKLKLVEILKEQGFVSSYLVDKDQQKIRIFLKYRARKPVINGLERISKPGLRRYVNSDQIPRVFNGLGISIVSTSSGIMTGEQARQKKIGGELWCKVW